MKKLAIAAVAWCVAATATVVSAAENEEISLYYNGEIMESTAVMIDGSAYVRYDDFLNELGAMYFYSNATGQLTARLDSSVITLEADSQTMTVEQNNTKRTVRLDSAPVKKSGVLMLPLRSIAETADCEVEWYAPRWSYGYSNPSVYIFNQSDFEESFSEQCPKISRILEINKSLNEIPMTMTGTLNIAYNYKYSNDYSFSGYADILADMYQFGRDLEFGLSGGFYIGDEEDSFGMDGVSIDGIISDNTFYFKTNALEKYADWQAANGEEETARTAAQLLDDKWLSTPLEYPDDFDILDIFDIITGIDDSSGARDKSVKGAEMINTLSQYEDFVSFTQTDTDSYIIDFNITNDKLEAAGLMPESVMDSAWGISRNTDTCISVVEIIENNSVTSVDVYAALSSDTSINYAAISGEEPTVEDDYNSKWGLFIQLSQRPAEERELQIPENAIDISEAEELLDSMDLEQL